MRIKQIPREGQTATVNSNSEDCKTSSWSLDITYRCLAHTKPLHNQRLTKHYVYIKCHHQFSVYFPLCKQSCCHPFPPPMKQTSQSLHMSCAHTPQPQQSLASLGVTSDFAVMQNLECSKSFTYLSLATFPKRELTIVIRTSDGRFRYHLVTL